MLDVGKDADVVDVGICADITAGAIRILFISMLPAAGIGRFTAGKRAGAGRTVKFHKHKQSVNMPHLYHNCQP